MAYQATVCKVMIASPGDVVGEKRIAHEVIAEWNDLHSERAKIVLLPVEGDTHSAPAMGGRAQAIINKQVLAGCDLLIGIFWTRVGTPTGQEISGTVEEIKEHRKAGKPAMLYFSSVPVRLDSADQDQYERLKEFRESCKSQGLIDTYDDIAEFSVKLRKHLIKTIYEDDYFKAMVKERGEPATETSIPNAGPALSKEARDLLLEAVQDPAGSVLRILTLGGLIVQVNRKNMVGSRDARSEATWEGAVKELEEQGMIEDQGYKREVFAVTHAGYELADRLRQQ